MSDCHKLSTALADVDAAVAVADAVAAPWGSICLMSCSGGKVDQVGLDFVVLQGCEDEAKNDIGRDEDTETEGEMEADEREQEKADDLGTESSGHQRGHKGSSGVEASQKDVAQFILGRSSNSICSTSRRRAGCCRGMMKE